MSEAIITVENLSKSYRLQHQARERYSTLRDLLANKIRELFCGKAIAPANSEEEFWALKDVSFEIKQGEVVGIIGRNGAGKSTLLKILSRITEPTSGRITLRGRVASLLEVGTGFHPELTGRENIFLNGAILGMHRQEIRRKFDEIVEFAEVEKFLDTPVKRYSSGMYLRLAFAVAAHLEPEILIVDEVLAVGDAEFQRKCLGKMQEVSKGGRTVLFVSHNMAAMKALTSHCIVLQAGCLAAEGSPDEMIASYLRVGHHGGGSAKRKRQGKHSHIQWAKINEMGSETRADQSWPLEVAFHTDGTPGMSMEVFLVSPRGERIALFSLAHFHAAGLPRRAGRYLCRFIVAPGNLASGRYTLDVATSITNLSWDDYVEQALVIDIQYCNPSGLSWDFKEAHGFGHLALRSLSPPEFTILPNEEGIPTNDI